MKIEIKEQEGKYRVIDEFGFLNQVFDSYEKANEYLVSKIAEAKVLRVIYYVRKEIETN